MHWPKHQIWVNMVGNNRLRIRYFTVNLYRITNSSQKQACCLQRSPRGDLLVLFFFSRSWFRRLWTVQEPVLGSSESEVVLIYEDQQITWDTMSVFLDLTWRTGSCHLRQGLDPSLEPILRRRWDQLQGRLSAGCSRLYRNHAAAFL